MQFALREMRALAAAPRLWATFAVVVLIFTVTGPFGSLAMPVAPRFFYWLSVQFAGWATAIAGSILADAFLAGRIRSGFARMMLGSLIAALPIAFWIELIELGFSGKPPTLAAYWSNLAVALPLSALFCVLAYMTLRREIDAVASRPEAPPLLARLRPENRGPLLRLSAEDHYTEVVTAHGRELVLIRFSDALKETGATPGLRIHRSHWIADAHVAGWRRTGGVPMLVARDGAALPVSRSSLKAARERYAATAGKD